MKTLFTTKKLLIILVGLIAISAVGYFIESEAGDTIAHRIEEQITLVGGEFDSISVSPVSQAVEIEGLKFRSERENAIYDFYVRKIVLDGVSLAAIDPDSGDYPLVAEVIEFHDIEFIAKNPNSSTVVKFENYTIYNWSQNVALLIAESEHGYGSLEFLERAFTFRYDKSDSSKTHARIETKNSYEDRAIEISLDSSKSTWNSDDIVSSSANNIEVTLADYEDVASFIVKSLSSKAPVYGVFDPKTLALITHLSLASYSDEYIEEVLLESLLEEENVGLLSTLELDISDSNFVWNDSLLFTNSLLALSSNLDGREFKIELKDLDFTHELYEILSLAEFLNFMKLDSTSIDYLLEGNVHEDNQTISFTQNFNVEKMFKSELSASIEMLESLENTYDNAPNKFKSARLVYEDTGFLPRYIKALEDNFGMSRNEAIEAAKSIVMNFAVFLPNLEEPIDELFKNLGKIEVELTEEIGVFDILFIPPANLVNLFNEKYTPSNTNLEEAINSL